MMLEMIFSLVAAQLWLSRTTSSPEKKERQCAPEYRSQVDGSIVAYMPLRRIAAKPAMAISPASKIIAHSERVGMLVTGGTNPARLLVKVHAMAAPATVAAASSVTVRVARMFVCVPPAPRPVQLMEVSV